MPSVDTEQVLALFSYARRIAEHERPHLDQMENILTTIAASAKE